MKNDNKHLEEISQKIGCLTFTQGLMLAIIIIYILFG